MDRKQVSIIIPSYNGQRLLEKFLPSVMDAAEHYGNCEVIVVDDGSSDESVDFIKNQYPSVKILILGRNVGFGKAVNAGVMQSKGDIIILLNNDVEVDDGFIAPLVAHFNEPDMFAVTARGIIPEMDYNNESVSELRFENGMFELVQPAFDHPMEKWNEPCTVAHACGGYSAFDRCKFQEIGGFDDLFFPFYWEDVDICYRAWKRGWWVVYEPKSTVKHHVHSTVYKVVSDPLQIQMLQLRNKLLFTWKNLEDMGMLEAHARRINYRIKEGQEPFKTGFYEALKRIMNVLNRRGKGKVQSHNILTDMEVLTLSSNLKYPSEATRLRKEMVKR